MLANQGGLEPFFDQPLARPRDRVDTALQGRRDLAVAPALTTVRGIGFQQDPGLQQLLCWMVSAMDKGGEMLSLLIAQCHYVFLYRDLFPGHQSAPSAATEPSSQTNTAESMTGATSAGDLAKVVGGDRFADIAKRNSGNEGVFRQLAGDHQIASLLKQAVVVADEGYRGPVDANACHTKAQVECATNASGYRTGPANALQKRPLVGVRQ